MARKTERGGRPVAMTEAAGLLGLNRGTLSDWQKAGCPAEKQGNAWAIRLGNVLAWREEQAVAKALAKVGAVSDDGKDFKEIQEEYKARKTKAEALRAEIELDETLKDVVRVSDVSDAVSEILQEVRTSLMALPASAAGRIAQIDDPAECAELLREMVDDALRALASREGIGGADGDLGED